MNAIGIEMARTRVPLDMKRIHSQTARTLACLAVMIASLDADGTTAPVATSVQLDPWTLPGLVRVSSVRVRLSSRDPGQNVLVPAWRVPPIAGEDALPAVHRGRTGAIALPRVAGGDAVFIPSEPESAVPERVRIAFSHTVSRTCTGETPADATRVYELLGTHAPDNAQFLHEIELTARGACLRAMRLVGQSTLSLRAMPNGTLQGVQHTEHGQHTRETYAFRP